MRRTIGVLVALVAAACGGGSSGGGGVGNPSGTAIVATGPLPLSAANSTAVTGGSTCQAGPVSAGVAFVAVIASDQAGICGYLQRNQNKANARSIGVGVVHIDPTSATTTVAPGNYPVTATPGAQTSFAVVRVSQNDAACHSSDLAASSGTVTVTSTANGRVQGTVNAQLAGGGDVTGSFDAEQCAVTFTGDVCTGQLGPVNPTCAP